MKKKNILAGTGLFLLGLIVGGIVASQYPLPLQNMGLQSRADDSAPTNRCVTDSGFDGTISRDGRLCEYRDDRGRRQRSPWFRPIQ